jgi:hypothetical protein
MEEVRMEVLMGEVRMEVWVMEAMEVLTEAVCITEALAAAPMEDTEVWVGTEEV